MFGPMIIDTEAPAWSRGPEVMISGQSYRRPETEIYSPASKPVLGYGVIWNYRSESDNGGEICADKERLAGKLMTYLRLEKDWDGYGGVPPTAQAVSDALTFIENLRAGFPALPLPKPMLSGDGEVGLYWDQAGVFADVGFTGDGTLSYYVESESGENHGKDDISLDDGKSLEPLLKMLQKAFATRAA